MIFHKNVVIEIQYHLFMMKIGFLLVQIIHLTYSSTFQIITTLTLEMLSIDCHYYVIRNLLVSDSLRDNFIFFIRTVLLFPLYLIFRKSLNKGIFPKMLKLSSVTPIYKSGNVTNVSN